MIPAEEYARKEAVTAQLAKELVPLLDDRERKEVVTAQPAEELALLMDNRERKDDVNEPQVLVEGGVSIRQHECWQEEHATGRKVRAGE